MAFTSFHVFLFVFLESLSPGLPDQPRSHGHWSSEMAVKHLPRKGKAAKAQWSLVTVLAVALLQGSWTFLVSLSRGWLDTETSHSERIGVSCQPCWWSKSCTTCDEWYHINHGIKMDKVHTCCQLVHVFFPSTVYLLCSPWVLDHCYVQDLWWSSLDIPPFMLSLFEAWLNRSPENACSLLFRSSIAYCNTSLIWNLQKQSNTTWNMKHMKTQFLLHWTTIFFSCHSPQGFLELRSAWSCVNLGIQELGEPCGQPVNKWSQEMTCKSPFWIDLMLEGASSSYGQTCDGARLLTWGNSSVRQCCQCNLMQVFGLVLKQSEKLFIISFSKIFSW